MASARNPGSWASGTAQRAGSVTGGVITAAGLVMAGTFVVLAGLPSVLVAEVGIAVVIGALVDTLLVRTVLVPASLLVIGERVWWPSRNSQPPAAAPVTSADTPSASVEE